MIYLSECIACQNQEYETLPPPHTEQAMLSDGTILQKPLEKAYCKSCGLVRHKTILSNADILAFYEKDYALPKQKDIWEISRAQKYSSKICQVLNGKQAWGDILEIGCGSGFLLKELQNKDLGISYEGIDPALTIEITDTSSNFYLHQTSDLTKLKKQVYDTIISINTLEHIANPKQALKNIAEKMHHQSDLILILPSHLPANVELLFFDHLWTFTPKAIDLLLKGFNLTIQHLEFLDGDLLGFTLFQIKKQKTTILEYQHSFGEYGRFLKAWQDLDSKLSVFLKQIENTEYAQIFGVGQMTSLLKCYAPISFQNFKYVVADQESDIWHFDQFLKYDSKNQKDIYTFICVHPTLENRIEQRILEDGGIPIRLSHFLDLNLD